MSENLPPQHSAIVIIGEDTESEDDELQMASKTTDSNNYMISNTASAIDLKSKMDSIFADDNKHEAMTGGNQTTELLSPVSSNQAQAKNIPSYNSILHKKLHEANFKLWNSINDVPLNTCRDIKSTMKRVCGRIDKTQVLAVDSSNKIRSSITNLQSVLKSTNAGKPTSRNVLPSFKQTQAITTV